MNQAEPNLVFVSHLNDGSDEDSSEENRSAIHALKSRESPKNKELHITENTANHYVASNGVEGTHLSQNSDALANNTEALQIPSSVVSTNDEATAFIPCLQFHDTSNHGHQVSDGSLGQMESTENHFPEAENSTASTVDGTTTGSIDMAVEDFELNPEIINNECVNRNQSVEPILIVPTGESQSSLEAGLPTHPEWTGDTDASLTMDTLLMNVQPIMIEPLSDDSDMDNNMDYQSGDIAMATKHFTRKKRPRRLSCFKCRKKFTDSVELLKHKELYCPKKRFQDNNVKIPQFTCLKCNYRSNGRTPLTTCILHTKIHDKLKYSCQECGVTFKWWNSVLRHWKDYHNTNEESVTEDDQEKEESGNQDSHCHVQVDTVGPVGRSEFFCSKCNTKFLSDYQLSQHLPSCWCICRCGFNSYSVRSSLHHMMNCAAINTSQLWFRRDREVVRPWTIPCPGCPFETDRERLLIDHLRRNSWHYDVLEANPVYMKRHLYTCPICFQYVLCSRTESEILCAVFYHMKLNHTAVFRCNFCLSFNSDMGILRKHMEVKHEDEPICTCLYCGRIFMKVGTTLMHMENHQRHAIYCQKCYWAFEDRYQYQSHIQSHHLPNHGPGIKLKCDVCTFDTVYSYELLEHRKQHSCLRLKCKLCNGLFLSNAHLQNHEKLHSEGMIVPRIIHPTENGGMRRVKYVFEKAGEDDIEKSSTVDSHNEGENQVIISPRWVDNKRTSAEKNPIMKQETAQLDNFVDRICDKTWKRTEPIYHKENLSAQFNTIQEIHGRMSATKSIQEHSCPCFLCKLHFPSTDYLVSHLQSRHGDVVHVSLCNPETIAVTFSRRNLCFTLCIGCKVCANSRWSGENRVFASMEKFEEHCSLYHPRASITDDIKCRVPGCTYTSYSEIHFYTHLAFGHKSKIELRIEHPSRLKIYHHCGKSVMVGERLECCMCRKVFFSQSLLQFHIVSHEKRASSNHQSLSSQIIKVLRNQPLPANIAEALFDNPAVVNKSRLQVRTGSRKGQGTALFENFFAVRYSSSDANALGRVRISLYRYSKGKETFIRSDSTGDDSTQNNDDDDMPCQVCEKTLGVQLPNGLCVHERQPLVTLNRNELRKYMLDCMLTRGMPLPRWYRVYAESSNWFMGWDTPARKRGPKRNMAVTCNSRDDRFGLVLGRSQTTHRRNISKTNRKTTTKSKFPKNVSDNSPLWLKYCRKCYKLYDVFVLLEMCVHKRFIIVSLVNPSDADRANASFYSETITATNESQSTVQSIAADPDSNMTKSAENLGMELGRSASGQKDKVTVFNSVPRTTNSIVIKTEEIHDLTSSIGINDVQNETNVEMVTDPLANIPPAVVENGMVSVNHTGAV